MRPVKKFNLGDVMLPDGNYITIKSHYNDYREAKTPLVINLGKFCSYCEDAYHQQRDLHVEHVQPKGYTENGIKIYDHLATQWSNFLLSCATCNGSDNKDSKNVILEECHLPHLNNTFLSLNYMQGGVVIVNPSLTGKSFLHAQCLLNLVGLDKSPKTSCPGDKRCEKRREDWKLACRYKQKYETGRIDIDIIVNLVQARGGWSIWFTVFKGHDEVRKALIDEFPGTAVLIPVIIMSLFQEIQLM